MAADTRNNGGRRGVGLTDDELAEECRLTRADVDVLRSIIQSGRPPRGAYAKLQALKLLARYGHAVPKGEAVKAEAPRPTVYVLERPAPDGPLPPLVPHPPRDVTPESVNLATEEDKGE